MYYSMGKGLFSVRLKSTFTKQISFFYLLTKTTFYIGKDS